MAGSKRWFRYNSDEGFVFALHIDESNTELVNTTASAQAVVPAGTRGLPKGFTARYVDIISDNNLVKRRCYVLDPDQYNALAVGDAYSLTPANFSGVGVNTPVQIRLKNPEIMRRQPYQGDSALVDGDNP